MTDAVPPVRVIAARLRSLMVEAERIAAQINLVRLELDSHVESDQRRVARRRAAEEQRGG